MGSTGKDSGHSYEDVKGLIFGTAHLAPTFVDIDGYSNKKTEKAMLRELAKAIRPYSDAEADNVLDMVKYNEMNQIPAVINDGASQYIIEWEEVPSAVRPKADNEDENEYEDAKWYVHIRFVRG